MRERMKARPQLESLESMTLLSGAAATALSPHHHAKVSITPTGPGAALTLSGTVRGSFLMNRGSSGKTYNIFTAGMLTPIGSRAGNGHLHVLSGISTGPPNGTLRLSTRRGTLRGCEEIDSR